MKIFICTNILTVIDAAAYVSACNFWYRLGKKYPDWVFYNMTPPRMAIDQARNWAARMALECECDYLMFIDDDMILHPDTLSSLIEANLDIVMAHTYIRGYPFNVMAFKNSTERPLGFFNDYKDFLDDKGIYLCDAVGFAVCLIKCSLLRRMEPPYFVTGTGHTEDIYFCCKARAEIGPEVSIGGDTKVSTGHLLHKESVNVESVEKLRVYYAEKKEEIVNGDRGSVYYRQISSVLGQD